MGRLPSYNIAEGDFLIYKYEWDCRKPQTAKSSRNRPRPQPSGRKISASGAPVAQSPRGHLTFAKSHSPEHGASDPRLQPSDAPITPIPHIPSLPVNLCKEAASLSIL